MNQVHGRKISNSDRNTHLSTRAIVLLIKCSIFATQVAYFITNGEGKEDFNITTKQLNTEGMTRYSGAVHVVKQLDREHREFYNLTVSSNENSKKRSIFSF